MELYNKSIKKKEKINKDVQLIFSQRLSGLEPNNSGIVLSSGLSILYPSTVFIEYKAVVSSSDK